MRLSLRWVISPLVAVVMILAPAQTMACIPGLQWGMDSSTVEERLNVSLETARSLEADSSVVYRISSQHIGDIPVEELDLRFSDQGLEQLVYSLPSDSMTEVLAGLRARYGSPVSTTVNHLGQIPQQIWIWNTEEDCITAVRTAVRAEDQKFLLSYRPSRPRPSLL